MKFLDGQYARVEVGWDKIKIIFHCFCYYTAVAKVIALTNFHRGDELMMNESN